MSRLQNVLSFLALPAEQQIQLLPEIPYDRGVPNYYVALDDNPILILVRGVAEDYSRRESESEADYHARTGLQPDRSYAALNELCCFILSAPTSLRRRQLLDPARDDLEGRMEAAPATGRPGRDGGGLADFMHDPGSSRCRHRIWKRVRSCLAVTRGRRQKRPHLRPHDPARQTPQRRRLFHPPSLPASRRNRHRGLTAQKARGD